MKRTLLSIAAVSTLLVAGCGGASQGGGTEAGPAETLAEASLELRSLPEPLVPTEDADGDFELKIAWAIAPFTLDPHKDFDAFVGFGYDSLLMLDDQRRLMPGLAESFEVSDDLRTLTFTLRDGVKFSDGTVMTSESAVASLERARTFEESKYVGALSSIESLEAPDARTVVVNLAQPDSALILALAGPAGSVINQKAIADPAFDFAMTTAGTTPLDVAEYKPGTYIRWTRDEARSASYFDPAAFQFSSVSVSEASDRTAALNGLRSGNFNLVDFGGPTEQAKSQLGDEYTFALLPADAPRSLWLNDKIDGPLQDPEIRKAVIQAIDRTAIASNVIPRCSPMTQLARDGSSAYLDDFDPLSHDPEAAASVLEGKDIELELVTAVNAEEVAAATAMQQDLADVGVKLTITQLPIVEGQGAIASTPVGYFVQAARADFAATIEAFWLTPPFQAVGPTDKAQIEEMVDTANGLALGSTERATALQELNEFASSLALQVPVCTTSSLWISPPELVGADSMQNGWGSQFSPRYLMKRD